MDLNDKEQALSTLKAPTLGFRQIQATMKATLMADDSTEGTIKQTILQTAIAEEGQQYYDLDNTYDRNLIDAQTEAFEKLATEFSEIVRS